MTSQALKKKKGKDKKIKMINFIQVIKDWKESSWYCEGKKGEYTLFLKEKVFS